MKLISIPSEHFYNDRTAFPAGIQYSAIGSGFLVFKLLSKKMNQFMRIQKEWKGHG